MSEDKIVAFPTEADALPDCRRPPATAAEKAHFMDADNWSVSMWTSFGPHDVCVFRDGGRWRWRALASRSHVARVTSARTFPSHAAARADAWGHLEPGLNWDVPA